MISFSKLLFGARAFGNHVLRSFLAIILIFYFGGILWLRPCLVFLSAKKSRREGTPFRPDCRVEARGNPPLPDWAAAARREGTPLCPTRLGFKLI